MKKKSKKKKHSRSFEALTAIFHCKGGPMRHKNDRRKKQKKNDWKKEEN